MKSSERPTVVAVLAALAVLVALAGCGVVSKPDAATWDDQATQALTDAGSEVATARLALESARKGQAWSAYTVVVVAKAEEAVGTTTSDLSRLQVPRDRTGEAAKVIKMLRDAADLVAQARAHAVAGRYDGGSLIDRLDSMSRRLEDAQP